MGSNLLLHSVEDAALVLLDGLWRCISPNVHLRVGMLGNTDLSGELLLGVFARHFVLFLSLSEDSAQLRPSPVSACSAWCSSVAIQTHSLDFRGSTVKELLMLVEKNMLSG